MRRGVQWTPRREATLGGTGLKATIGIFLVWLSAQMGAFAQEVLGRVRESVQASELLEIDRWVYKASAFDDEKGKTRSPRDQDEFERIVRDSLEASGGRNVVLDRWEQPYVYERIAKRDPRAVAYRISSRGPDRQLGTADDLVVERDEDHVEINRDPVKIAEQAIERKKELDHEVARRLSEIVQRAPARASDPHDATAERAAREFEAATRELVRLLERS